MAILHTLFPQNAFVVVVDIFFDSVGPMSRLLASQTVQALYDCFFDNENFGDVVFRFHEAGTEKRLFFYKNLLIRKCEYFADSEWLFNQL
jgi:hypothetical protein